MIREMRDHDKVAVHIKFPPLPAVFSESIVIAATPTLVGPEWTARFGGRVCDVVLTSNTASAEKRIEVKATGRHAFQELKEKDLRADFLVWIRFGRRFEAGHGPIVAVVLESPGKYITEAQRLDVNRFEAIPGVLDNQRLFRFDSLDDLVTGTTSGVGRSSGESCQTRAAK